MILPPRCYKFSELYTIIVSPDQDTPHNLGPVHDTGFFGPLKFGQITSIYGRTLSMG